MTLLQLELMLMAKNNYQNIMWKNLQVLVS